MASVRRVLHPRSGFRARWDQAVRRVQPKGGWVLLGLSIGATALLLTSVPVVWVNRYINSRSATFQESHWEQVQAVYRAWVRYDRPPAFDRGDEPDARRYLEGHPLVVGLVLPGGQTWIREADRFRPAAPTEGVPWQAWMAEAQAAGRLVSSPPPSLDPSAAWGPAVVLRGEGAAVVQRWVPGSPAVERFLSAVQRGRRSMRIGLRRMAEDQRHEGPAAGWGLPPHLQADFPRGQRSPWEIVGNDESFGEGWEVAALPGPDDQRALDAGIRRQQRLAFLVYAGLVAALSAGLYLRHRARNRERQDADRIASMAHSLKTPLAILKLRCDSLRLRSLPPDQAEAQLIRIGEEVESLVGLIETHLASLQAKGSPSPRGQADEAFYAAILADLAPAFDLDGRELRTELGDLPHAAHLPTLRNALVTLLENALIHGEGPTTLRVFSHRSLACVSVASGGPGLEDSRLKALGRPFLRFRDPQAEGFRHEGQGLGLFLLLQAASLEGWGVTFRSDPGEGLEVELALPTEPRTSWT